MAKVLSAVIVTDDILNNIAIGRSLDCIILTPEKRSIELVGSYSSVAGEVLKTSREISSIRLRKIGRLLDDSLSPWRKDVCSNLRRRVVPAGCLVDVTASSDAM
jgi:hypothetical protein